MPAVPPLPFRSTASGRSPRRAPVGGLPYVDRHEVLVPAPADVVWPVVAAAFAGGGDRRGVTAVLARLLGAMPARTTGAPLAKGSTTPGFAVAHAVPGRSARLVGLHRFSRYALVVEADPRAGGTLVSATTYAAFPKLRGRLYRAAVIGSGAHAVLLRRRLAGVRDRCGNRPGNRLAPGAEAS